MSLQVLFSSPRASLISPPAVGPQVAPAARGGDGWMDARGWNSQPCSQWLKALRGHWLWCNLHLPPHHLLIGRQGGEFWDELQAMHVYKAMVQPSTSPSASLSTVKVPEAPTLSAEPLATCLTFCPCSQDIHRSPRVRKQATACRAR